MSAARQRQRGGAATEETTPTPARSRARQDDDSDGWGMTGKGILDGAEKAKREAKRKQEVGFMPFRFYVKGGEECEIILLDESIETGFAFYEHTLQDAAGIWNVHEPCIKDFAQCPICEKVKASSYVLMLSVLVLKPFKTKKGVTIPHSKMLLPVTSQQFDHFRQLEAAAKEDGNTLRGMYLIMGRSATDTKSPRIGTPVPMKGGKLFDILTEKELVKDYGHKEVKADDGKLLRAANFDITPYPYAKLFPKPDVADIAARYGGKAAAGSAREVAEEFEKETHTADAEEAPSRSRRKAEEAPAGRTRRKASDDAFND